MRGVFLWLALALLAGADASAAPPGGGILLTPAWLAEHLQDPSLVVLHVAGLREDYDREHIPGARFLWTTWMAESSPERTFEMVPAKGLDEVLSRLGVSWEEWSRKPDLPAEGKVAK